MIWKSSWMRETREDVRLEDRVVACIKLLIMYCYYDFYPWRFVDDCSCTIFSQRELYLQIKLLVCNRMVFVSTANLPKISPAVSIETYNDTRTCPVITCNYTRLPRLSHVLTSISACLTKPQALP